MWPTQTWITKTLKLATVTFIIIEVQHFYLPDTSKQDPFFPRLKLRMDGSMLLQEQTPPN